MYRVQLYIWQKGVALVLTYFSTFEVLVQIFIPKLIKNQFPSISFSNNGIWQIILGFYTLPDKYRASFNAQYLTRLI